ncbi:MAG: hypothetical protein GXP24_04910 [Planctomycetes bacterium]|nr:hypothetical protein [Planctomycetota bacterium]
MPGTVAHKLLTIFMLAIVARVPIPWVHRHADVEVSQLSAHLSARHSEGLELELPNGWHVHFLIPSLGIDGDRGNDVPRDSKDAPNSSHDHHFCETDSESETHSKLGSPIAVSDLLFTRTLLDLQAGNLGTRENALARADSFAESGQWRYALSVLLI